MNTREAQSFLRQFREAPKRMVRWPKWMRDAARTAAATFPKWKTP